MGSTSNPKTTAQLLAAQSIIGVDPFQICLTGQITPIGAAAVSGTVYSDIERKTDAELEALFGTNTEFINRIKKSRKVIKGRVPIFAIGIDAAAGSSAIADIPVVGTATAAGTIKIKVIDENLYTTNVSVAIGDTDVVVAAAIETAIDVLITEGLPVSASLTLAHLTLITVDTGTIGNKYTLEVSGLPAGITITGSPKIQFLSGATDPTTTTIFDNATALRFHAISWPWLTDYSDLEDFLTARNVIDNKFLQGVGFLGYDDTESNISTALNGATPENSLNLVFMGNREISGVGQIITPPDWRVVEFIAIEALRLTDDVPIAQYVTVSADRDTFGNIGLASLAYHNTPLALTNIPDSSKLFDQTAQDNLTDDGFTIVGVNESNTNIIMGDVVTTYKFNSRGESDLSFKYLNYVRTGFYALELFFNTLKSDYSQSRLTEGVLIAGRSMTNEDQIKSNCATIFKKLGGTDFVLCQAGSDAEKYFFSQLNVTVDLQTGKATVSGQLPIVTQVRKINITFQMSFSIGG